MVTIIKIFVVYLCRALTALSTQPYTMNNFINRMSSECVCNGTFQIHSAVGEKGQHNAKKLATAEWTPGVEIAALGGDLE